MVRGEIVDLPAHASMGSEFLDLGPQAGRLATLFLGDVLYRLRHIPDDSVQCVVTSPPYWGLRDYGIPPGVWDAEPGCEHEWVTEEVEREMRLGKNLRHSIHSHAGGALKCAKTPNQKFTRGVCSICGAWQGRLGLEPTPELFIRHTVEVFREVRRVLRPDGTLWLNIGDSYAGARRGGHSGYDSTTLTGSLHNQDESHRAAKLFRTGKDCDPKRGAAAAAQSLRLHSQPPARQ